MRLSKLQKYILKKCYHSNGNKVGRDKLINFYNGKKEPSTQMQVKIITGSLENMIDKELIIGFGKRTPKKWFITDVKLTDKGIVEARKLFGEQLKLPIKK